MKNIIKQIATILFLFTILLTKAQEIIPDDQQYAEFSYAELGLPNADKPKILIISSYIYKLWDNYGDAASTVLNPYFYGKIEQIKKEGLNGSELVLKSKIKQVHAVIYNGKMSSYSPDEDIQFNKNVKSTTSFVVNARQAVLDKYLKKGYTIYQTDFSSNFSKSSYYKYTKKVEKLLPTYIEEYKSGSLASIAKNYPNTTEIQNTTNDKEIQSKGNKEIKEYFDNGKLSAYGYKTPDEKETGEWKFYYQNGNLKEIGSFTDGKETGEWKTFFENEKLKDIGKYKKGLKDGEWKTYFEDGKLDMVGNYKDGKASGEAKSYYKNGKINSIANFSSDGKYITEKLYFENGNLESEGKYVIYTEPATIITSGGKTAPVGEWKLYHENGKLKAVGSYGGMNQNDMTGEWKLYDEKGTLREVASSFINGVPMKSQQYDENGKPIK